RETWPQLPIVGVEPGLKPAAALTRSGIVGVLATQRTVASPRFDALRAQVASATGVRFVAQACGGLADQIEKGELQSPATAALLHRYAAPLVEAGADTLVLGCTHYPFVQPLLEEVLAHMTPEPLQLVDTGEPVARQLARLLGERGLCNRRGGAVTGFTTAAPGTLSAAFERLLGLTPPVAQLATA
ncbi:glutamate racemase, partial [Oxalobacteraceae bacterium OM1]